MMILSLAACLLSAGCNDAAYVDAPQAGKSDEGFDEVCSDGATSSGTITTNQRYSSGDWNDYDDDPMQHELSQECTNACPDTAELEAQALQNCAESCGGECEIAGVSCDASPRRGEVIDEGSDFFYMVKCDYKVRVSATPLPLCDESDLGEDCGE